MAEKKEKRSRSSKAASEPAAAPAKGASKAAGASTKKEPSAARSKAAEKPVEPMPAPAAKSAAAPTARYLRNRETVRDKDMAAMEQLGAGSLAFLFAFGEALEEDQRLQKIERASRLFLIAVLCIAPVILMWTLAF